MARSQSKTMRLLAVMLLGLVTMVVHPSAAAAPAAGIGAQAVVMPADPPPSPAPSCTSLGGCERG